MTFKEIAHAIIASSGADETEVVYRRHDESLTRFANNHIHQNVTETDHEIAVRCVSGSRSGIAVSNIVHPESLRRLAQLAFDLAKQQPEILAYHCNEGGLIEKAINYWEKAGRKSAGQYAKLEAVVQLRRALDLLSRLVSKSLVVLDGEFDGERRYRLLETVRQYARERLVQSRRS